MAFAMMMSICTACGQQKTPTSSSTEQPSAPGIEENETKFNVSEQVLCMYLNVGPLPFSGVVTAAEVKEVAADSTDSTKVTARVAATAESVDTRMTAEYLMFFNLTEEGWAFLRFARDESVAPAYAPLAGVDKATADKEYGKENATFIGQKENLTAGLCDFTYETVETGKYATVTKKETLHYQFNTSSGKWQFKETTADEQNSVWQLDGLWLAKDGYDANRYVKLTVLETGTDYLRIVVNAQGEGGIIYDDKVAFDPLQGIDEVRIENPYDSWDSLYLHIAPDSVAVSRILYDDPISKKATYMEREDLFPPAQSAIPAATQFLYTLDKATQTAVIRSYKGSGIESLTVPSEIEGYTVVGIQDEAFRYHSELRALRLPDTVTFIGNRAFEGCDNLYSLYLPEGLTSIGEYAFYGCDVLFEFTLPESLQTIGKYAFANTGFDSIVLPESITEIEEGVFSSANLRFVTFGSNLTTIGKYAFSRTNIMSMTIPGTVKVIAESAFERCLYLDSLTIEDGVETVGEKAFYQNKSLKELVLPESVREIGKESFRACETLESITLSPNIKTLPWCCFANLDALTTLNIPEGITTIGEAAFGLCLQLNVMELPASIQAIEDYAFERAEQLTTIYFAGTEAQWEKLTSSLKGNEYANSYMLEANIKCESQMP